MLDLTVLLKVEVCKFFGFFELFLLRFEFVLEFVDEVLESLEVLLVFINLELEFTETTIGLGEVLVGFLVATLFSIEFGFEFTLTLFELGNDLLASLEGSLFGFIKTDLYFLDLLFESVTKTVNVLRVFLFLTEFFSKFGSIGTSAFGTFLSILVFVEGFVEIRLK